MKRMIKKIVISIILALCVIMTVYAVPPSPSCFWGTVRINNASVPNGTIVSAWINGVEYANTTTFIYNENSVYSICVPGDDPDTAPEIDGGKTNDTIVFKINEKEADQTGTWKKGSNTQLNLTSTGTITQVTTVSIGYVTAEPNSTVTGIPIVIENAVNAGASTISLVYDPKVVTVSEVIDGDFDNTYSNIDNTKGKTNISVFQLQSAGLNGTVIIANLSFIAGRAGSCTLHLEATLKDATPESKAIPHQVEDGTFVIIGTSATTVSIENVSAELGETVTTQIMIKNAKNVSSATVNLTYNSSVIQIISAKNSDFGTFVPNLKYKDNVARIVAFHTEPLNGNVKLAEITLKAINAGSSPLNLEVETLKDLEGNQIQYAINNGLFTVISIDLTITDISTPPTIYANQSNTINAYISNKGNKDITSFKVTLNANNSLVDTQNVEYLEAGKNTIIKFNWTPIQIGDYQLEVIVDPDNAINESNEANNILYKNVTALHLIKKPDLTITEIFTATIYTNQTNIISVNISNIGILPASNYKVSLNVNNNFVASQYLEGLAAGDSTTINFNWMPIKTGNYQLCVIVDSDDVINESNEANNILYKNVIALQQPPGEPDLTVTEINTPQAIYINQNNIIETTLENIGTKDATSFKATLNVNNLLVDTKIISNLAKGANTSVNFNWKPNKVGVYQLSVIVDPNDEIIESNEYNNILYKTVKSEEKPDLVVSEINTSQLIYTNQNNIINAKLENIGNSDASSFKITLNANNLLVGEQTIEYLASAKSTIIKFNWTPIQIGNYQLEVIVDSENAIDELNEYNNRLFKNVEVIQEPRPDLTVTEINTSQSIYINQNNSINANLENIGNKNAMSFKVTLNANNLLIDTKIISDLAKGANTSVNFNWKPNKVGVYQLSVVVDPNNEIIESNEYNNIISCEVNTISNASVHEKVIINSFEVSNGTQGGSITAKVNITNIGEKEYWYAIVVSGTNIDGYGISGIGSAELKVGETKIIPVLISIPPVTPTGDYTLYAGVYLLDEYPNNLQAHSSGKIANVAGA